MQVAEPACSPCPASLTGLVPGAQHFALRHDNSGQPTQPPTACRSSARPAKATSTRTRCTAKAVPTKQVRRPCRQLAAAGPSSGIARAALFRTGPGSDLCREVRCPPTHPPPRSRLRPLPAQGGATMQGLGEAGLDHAALQLHAAASLPTRLPPARAVQGSAPCVARRSLRRSPTSRAKRNVPETKSYTSSAKHESGPSQPAGQPLATPFITATVCLGGKGGACKPEQQARAVARVCWGWVEQHLRCWRAAWSSMAQAGAWVGCAEVKA